MFNGNLKLPSLKDLPPGTFNYQAVVDMLKECNINDPKYTEKMLKHSQRMESRFSPFKTLPCANVPPLDLIDSETCRKPGSKACGACKLVSYCSKECQNKHWKKHKGLCKSYMRSPDWIPEWVEERRLPDFLPANMHYDPATPEGGSDGGSPLWNTMPPVDLINLGSNEQDKTKDFNLAFVASGDLRSVMKTVNSLPDDFSGKLKIIINDQDHNVTWRNLVILLSLGRLSVDDGVAPDVALHFWFSLMMPEAHAVKAAAVNGDFVNFMQSQTGDSLKPYPLGPNSTIKAALSLETLQAYTLHMNMPRVGAWAQKGYDATRMDPARIDFWGRIYTFLRPSHRAAYHMYRRFGLVLPFGAVTAEFNFPNASLFTDKGKWLQNDHVTPLQGWNINEVIEAGKARGAHAEDIFGCLYFYLFDQLNTFAKRIQKFRIEFQLFPFEAETLSRSIQNDMLAQMDLGRCTLFDRIDVSNLLDHTSDGLKEVLTQWAPLLAEREDSAIVGYFKDWGVLQKDGRIVNADDAICTEALKVLMQKTQPIFRDSWDRLGVTKAATFSLLKELDVVYENSKPFAQFLKERKAKHLLRKTQLQLRGVHRIVGPRLMVPIQAPHSAMPTFADEDDWYYHTKLTRFSWAERFVELSRV